MLGIGAWLDTISLGSPFWGIIRGLVYTLLMVAVTCFFTRRNCSGGARLLDKLEMTDGRS
jgi:hypothetical protein